MRSTIRKIMTVAGVLLIVLQIVSLAGLMKGNSTGIASGGGLPTIMSETPLLFSYTMGYFLGLYWALIIGGLLIAFAPRVEESRPEFGKSILSVGIIGIILQIMAIAGHVTSGLSVPFPTYWSAETIIAFLKYYSMGLCGIVLMIVGKLLSETVFNTSRAAKTAARNAIEEAQSEGTVFCPECGGSVKAGELFCPKCNHKM